MNPNTLNLKNSPVLNSIRSLGEVITPKAAEGLAFIWLLSEVGSSWKKGVISAKDKILGRTNEEEEAGEVEGINSVTN